MDYQRAEGKVGDLLAVLLSSRAIYNMDTERYYKVPTWDEVEASIRLKLPLVVQIARATLPELASRLAKYKIPRELRFVDSLPRTAYGKVVKGELRDRYEAEKDADD